MKTWKGYEKGVNLGGWFSQCDYTTERYENFITKEDIKNLSTWGIDHVRVPVDYNLVEDDSGNFLETGFTYLQRIIDWCGEYGLNMILDLHKTAGYSFDEGEEEDGFFTTTAYQERFYTLWEEFAERFGPYKNRLAFELLNEVTDISYNEEWKRISGECIRRIRHICPDIDILVGGYWNNNVRAVKDLALPVDDHIIYNFHCYDPLVFTHQGATWVSGMSPDYRFSYDHTYQEYYDDLEKIFGDSFGEMPKVADMNATFGPDFFRTIFAEAIEVAKERNVALYCGEYGVIDLANPADTLKWFQAIHEVFEENGIGRAAWSYHEMNFGLNDEHYAGILDELKKYL